MVSLSWSSSDPQVASVDQTGLVQAISPGQSLISTALDNGIAAVHAKVNGVKSNSLDLNVGTVLLGEFVPAGDYIGSGTVMLRLAHKGSKIWLGIPAYVCDIHTR